MSHAWVGALCLPQKFCHDIALSEPDKPNGKTQIVGGLDAVDQTASIVILQDPALSDRGHTHEVFSVADSSAVYLAACVRVDIEETLPRSSPAQVWGFAPRVC